MVKGEKDKNFELTAFHVRCILFSAFAIVLGANITMIMAATGSFPGVTSKNTWVASQEFTMRSAERERLGWKLSIDSNGAQLLVRAHDAEGAPLEGVDLAVVVGRPADARTDRRVTLAPTAEPGVFTAQERLERGAWRVALTAEDAEGRRIVASGRIVVK